MWYQMLYISHPQYFDSPVIPYQSTPWQKLTNIEANGYLKNYGFRKIFFEFRASRVSFVLFWFVKKVTISRASKENSCLTFSQSLPFLKTTNSSRKLRLNRTINSFAHIGHWTVLSRFRAEKIHNAISSRRCMRIRGKLALRLAFPIIQITIVRQNGDNFGKCKPYHFPTEKRARYSPRRRRWGGNRQDRWKRSIWYPLLCNCIK